MKYCLHYGYKYQFMAKIFHYIVNILCPQLIKIILNTPPPFKIRLWSEISVYFLWKQVPNSAIRDCTNVTDMSGKEFLNPAEDKTVNLNAK